MLVESEVDILVKIPRLQAHIYVPKRNEFYFHVDYATKINFEIPAVHSCARSGLTQCRMLCFWETPKWSFVTSQLSQIRNSCISYGLFVTSAKITNVFVK